jgi:hypothetical protein
VLIVANRFLESELEKLRAGVMREGSWCRMIARIREVAKSDDEKRR